MAKVNPILAQYSSAVGHELHYTRFGRTYSRQLPAEYNDRKSESQLRQRALFKARQATSAHYGSILQRGLTKEAHENGMTEANYFSRLNKDHFVYEDGTVRINYPALLLARGPLPVAPCPWLSLPAAVPTVCMSTSTSDPVSMPQKSAPTMSSTSMPSLCR